MSLINCPECAHEVSTEAVACPSCGRPLAVAPPVVPRRVVVTETESSDFPSWIFIPIILIAVLVVVAVFAMTRSSENEAVRTTNVNIAVPTRAADTRETTTRTTTAQNEIEVPSSSSTVTTPPASTTQNVPPARQTEIVNAAPDRGTVEINAKISTRSGAVQNVRNEKFYLLDEDLETILREADLEPIEGQTLTNSLGLAILYPERYADFRRDALGAINKHVKYDATTDAGGKASMKDIKPDSYYLFGITKSGSGFAVWSSPVTIIEGENKLNLSPASLNEISGTRG